jgi:hypothetical protein
MRERPSVARFAKKLLGERYWAVRLMCLRAEERVRGMPERARFAKGFADREGTLIRRGPFKGMRYFKRVVGPTTLVPMLLGIYEQELHTVIEEEIACEPRFVVDIGSAEGYYAVGVARRLPRSHVVAFEIDPQVRHMCRRLARLNGVSARVEVRGECDTRYLAGIPSGTLIFSDCEGAEMDLLDPSRAPALRKATMIVEVHDFVDSAISDTLKTRFSSSHDIEELPTRPRDPSSYPELAQYSQFDAMRAVSEERPGDMTWLVMRPHPLPTGPSSAGDQCAAC